MRAIGFLFFCTRGRNRGKKGAKTKTGKVSVMLSGLLMVRADVQCNAKTDRNIKVSDTRQGNAENDGKRTKS